jgi:hypothetical protein
MSPNELYSAAVAISFLVAVVAGLRATKWTDVVAPVLLVNVLLMVGLAIATGVREHLPVGMFGQLAAFLVIAWIVFVIRRGLGAGWRRLRG